MKPIKFDEYTNVLAEDQSQYQPLPVYDNGEEMISCWKLNLWERLVVFVTGKLWLRQLTFGNPLQPQLPTVQYPFEPISPCDVLR